MNEPAALYARVSCDRQKENHTIASQVAALMQFAEANGYLVPPEWQSQDNGFYEKVIKVKADVAALLIFFSDIAVTSRMAWRVVKGAVFWRSS